MNILLLVFSFLLIFLFFNGSLTEKNALSSYEKNYITTYLTHKQTLYNEWEKHKYAKQKKILCPPKKRASNKNETLQKIDAPKTKSFFRTTIPSAKGKWNLDPLLKDTTHSPYLHNATIQLLELLYGHTHFWQQAKLSRPTLAEDLLASFLASENVKELYELFPEDTQLEFVFYTMLQGSGIYNITLKQGYPPLKDFFAINSNSCHIISIPHATPSSLQALFGQKATDAILQLEQEETNGQSITQDKLDLLLDHTVATVSKQDLTTFFSFSPDRSCSIEELRQDTDGINLRLSIPKKDTPKNK